MLHKYYVKDDRSCSGIRIVHCIKTHSLVVSHKAKKKQHVYTQPM